MSNALGCAILHALRRVIHRALSRAANHRALVITVSQSCDVVNTTNGFYYMLEVYQHATLIKYSKSHVKSRVLRNWASGHDFRKKKFFYKIT